jgi:glycosyltransferase involved in cell wall biosynthesis
VAWIHTDYSTLEVDAASETDMWGRYDKIVSISDDVSRAFLSAFPTLEDKLIRVDNIISPEGIIASSRKDAPGITRDGITLLSCGRVTEGKNFGSIPKMCKRLLEDGHDVKWYIVGDGPAMDSVREAIAEAEMTDRVLLLGAKADPYPYMARCDLYVQPSLYEGKAVAVREAQILGKPVVITDFPTAKSQLEDGYDGLIAPLDTEKCAEFISRLLSSPEKMKALSDNCISRDYSNGSQAEILCELINDEK